MNVGRPHTLNIEDELYARAFDLLEEKSTKDSPITVIHPSHYTGEKLKKGDVLVHAIKQNPLVGNQVLCVYSTRHSVLSHVNSISHTITSGTGTLNPQYAQFDPFAKIYESGKIILIALPFKRFIEYTVDLWKGSSSNKSIAAMMYHFWMATENSLLSKPSKPYQEKIGPFFHNYFRLYPNIINLRVLISTLKIYAGYMQQFAGVGYQQLDYYIRRSESFRFVFFLEALRQYLLEGKSTIFSWPTTNEETNELLEYFTTAHSKSSYPTMGDDDIKKVLAAPMVELLKEVNEKCAFTNKATRKTATRALKQIATEVDNVLFQ